MIVSEKNQTFPLISVILPIYNVGAYLEKCLDSIILQTYSNLEVILVDDGSTDGCYEICEKYKNMDKRIVPVHKKNGGVSSARNAGLDSVHGELVTFIDPDDFVAPDYIETLFITLVNNDADISVCGIKTAFSLEHCNQDNEEHSISSYSTSEAIEKMLYQNEIDVSAWAKMYKATLFDGIRYPHGEINEDTAITYQVFAKAKKVTFDRYKCYFYLQHSESIMHQKFASRKLSLIGFSKECVDFVEREFPSIKKAAICKHVTDGFVLVCKIYECKEIDKDSLRKCWSIIRKYRMTVILDPKARKKTKLACLTSFLGPRVVAAIKNKKSRNEEKKGIREI